MTDQITQEIRVREQIIDNKRGWAAVDDAPIQLSELSGNALDRMAEAVYATAVDDFKKAKIDKLENWFNAWRSYSDTRIDIARELGLGFEHPPSNDAANYNIEESRRPIYSKEDMSWFDTQILRLNPSQKRLIHYDVIHKGGKDKRKVDKWLTERKLLGVSNWYNMRTRIRQKLTEAIEIRNGY
jgi:hypothetical protein